MKSKLGTLNIIDFVKGAILAVITAVLTLVYDLLQTGSTLDNLNYKLILSTAIITFIGYILKNIGTNNKDEFLKADKK